MSDFHERFAEQIDQVGANGSLLGNPIGGFDDFGNHVGHDNSPPGNDIYSSPTFAPLVSSTGHFSPTRMTGMAVAMKPTAQDLQQELQNIHLSPQRRYSMDSYLSPPQYHQQPELLPPAQYVQRNPYQSAPMYPIQTATMNQYDQFPAVSRQPTYFPESHIQPHPFPYDQYHMDDMDVYDESDSFPNYEREIPPQPPTLEFSKKPRKTEFCPYSLKEFQQLPQIERKQSLGVNKQRPDLVQKVKNRNLVREYAQIVKEKNKHHKPKPKFVEPKTKSKTQKANEYAASVRLQHQSTLQTARSNPESNRPNYARAKSVASSNKHHKPRRRRMSVDVLDSDLNRLKALHAKNRAAAERMED